MSAVHSEFAEATARPRAQSVPLSHVSLELGHLYMEDLQAGPGRLTTLFAEARPWHDAVTAALPAARGRRRVSTCFLVDDYFSKLVPPAELVPQIQAAAAAAGLRVDYLARESGCAEPSEIAGDSPADLLLGRLVPEPVEGTTGRRPSATRTGWLCNGERSPSAAVNDAIDVARDWSPPRQAAARRHSIFVDVQLWDEDGGTRTWSCPLLAAAWQLMRLGLVRDDAGRPVGEPVDADPEAGWPSAWSDLSPVLRLNPVADPFFAYTTSSILSSRFLPVELAVRTILGQVWHDPQVTGPIAARAAQEGLVLPEEILDRIGYVFAGSGRVDPA